MNFVILIFLSFSAFAQQSTCRPPGIKFPVLDQDGLGVCASTTASLLMQHNFPDLRNAPSYLALGISSSYARANSFFNARGESFVTGNQICDVVKTAEVGFSPENSWCEILTDEQYAEIMPMVADLKAREKYVAGKTEVTGFMNLFAGHGDFSALNAPSHETNIQRMGHGLIQN